MKEVKEIVDLKGVGELDFLPRQKDIIKVFIRLRNNIIKHATEIDKDFDSPMIMLKDEVRLIADKTSIYMVGLTKHLIMTSAFLHRDWDTEKIILVNEYSFKEIIQILKDLGDYDYLLEGIEEC